AAFAHFLLKLSNKIDAAVGRRVAAVHEAVDKNVFDFLLLGEFEQREKMLHVRVNAAIAEQSEEMQLTLAASFHGLLKKRNFAERFVGDQHVDFGDVHADNAAGADIHDAAFAVAHLGVAQAD